MKRCLTSLIIREMQIKTIIRYQLHPLGWPLLKKIKRQQCWVGCAEPRTLVNYWWKCKMVQPLWKTLWWFLRKLKIELPYDPAVPLLGITQKNWNRVLKGFICYTQNHKSIIHKSWNMKGTHVLIGWMEKQICYIHMLKYYSALKRKEILI